MYKLNPLLLWLLVLPLLLYTALAPALSNPLKYKPAKAIQSAPCNPVKISLNPAMVTNESGKGDAAQLVDEQTAAGSPAEGQGGSPSTNWFPGWGADSYPASAYLDLGKPMLLTSVFLRDINDIGDFVIETGAPGNWTKVVTDHLTGYQSWNQHQLNVTTRYLRFTRMNAGANMTEIVLYGCSDSISPDKDKTAPAAVTTLQARPISSSAVQLSWKATGDDGQTGTAKSYDVRWSTKPFSSQNTFGSGTKVQDAPQPAKTGTLQKVTVQHLSPQTTYYFALKVVDEAGNTSPLSNTAQATTSALDNNPSPTDKITMDGFIGINAFVDDPIEKVQVAGFIREYHNWNWDEGNIWNGGGNTNYIGYPNNQIKWAPSEPGWNFDDYYTSVKRAGMQISPVIQGSVNWLHGGTSYPFANKPIDEPAASTTNPNSYEKKAHHLYQFAARYGSRHVADNKLTLAPGQPRHTGLNLVQYIEDWNEQDNDWNGPDANFSPQEYAAMASANYDGHANTMKQGSGTFGVKNADPNMKLVMGGIYRLNLDYIKQMKRWFEQNRRDGKFAADVINVHTYAWKDGHGPGGGGPAKSPEEDDFKQKLREFVAYRNAHLPGLEVWISEFGWDTHPQSALRVPQIGPFDRQEVQGQWLVRAYLAFAAAGVDRAMMYMLRDVNPNDPTHFSTSGLVGPKGDWTPKKSWYYVYTLRNTLKDMVFLGEQASGNPNVLIYKFKSTTGPGGAYVVWAKTKQNYTLPGYKLSLTGSPTKTTRVEMKPGDTDGVRAVLPISSKSVKVDVSERPVFILVNDIK